ncbi:hypothetical protein F183_A33210 [Bryobacterales bacterium F-183]|nr:hypothetical protein F183_A33210 [Bryobacterales bacterium F-183]
MTELQRMLKGEAEQGRLDLAATEIARLEYPDLADAEVVDQLDAIAADVPAFDRGDGHATVDALNTVLFERWGFHGNDTEYYDARNSCLNEVIARRTGIPITLSVIYMEVARRLGQPVFGIGLPGHFVVEYDSGAYSAFLDPFHKGERLTPAECERLVSKRTGAVVEPGSLSFRKATKQAIVGRMLQNLKGIYAGSQQWAKVLRICDLLLEADPRSAAELRVRGAANLHLKRYSAGKADLEEYLRLAPGVPEAAVLREQIANLAKWSAQWN